jgi:hypothetical protein
MAFSVLLLTVIAPSYILNQIELEAKEYGIKNSIANNTCQHLISHKLDDLDFINEYLKIGGL